MKQLITLCFALVIGITNAQSNFEKGMDKAFDLWKADKTEEAQNLFERIANAEKDNWLPHYYIAQINSLKSWNVKDETVLKAQLDKAQDHLDIAMAYSQNNPELLIMQAQVYTNWVAYDGRTYGMKYAGKISELYQKAKQLDPKNPRAAFSSADWEMNSAKYFGKDTAPYCKAIANSIKLFDSHKPESKYHPNWGKERAAKVLETCK